MFIRTDRSALIHRLSNDVHDAAQRATTNGHLDGCSCVQHALSTHQACTGRKKGCGMHAGERLLRMYVASLAAKPVHHRCRRAAADRVPDW